MNLSKSRLESNIADIKNRMVTNFASVNSLYYLRIALKFTSMKTIRILFLLIVMGFNALAQDKPYVIVDQMPEFPGGKDSLNKYVLTKIRYPDMAIELGVRGKVHVGFVVNKSGRIEDVKVLKGLPGGLNREAMRVVKTLKYEPGKQSGHPVDVQMMLQVEFPLQKKVYKGDDSRVVYNKFPNADKTWNNLYMDNQYYIWIYNKGVEAMEHHKYKKAEEYFDQAIKIIGINDANPYFHRALARLEQGNQSGACGDFRRAEKLWYPDIRKTIKNVCKEGGL